VRLDERGKTVAMTKHKVKPDGTRELSHSIQREEAPKIAQLMHRAKTRKTASSNRQKYEDGTDKTPMPTRDLRTRRPRRRINALEAMTGQRGEAPIGANMMKTVAALRRARIAANREQLLESGAFEGEGNLERAAPRNRNRESYMLNETAAGGTMLEPHNAVNFPEEFQQPANDGNAYPYNPYGEQYVPLRKYKPLPRERITRMT
jgi:hypothetical protein